MIKKPLIFPIDCPQLLSCSARLPPMGSVQKGANQYVYLKIDDDYIHTLYPFLQPADVEKPDYFSLEGAGAHISLIYPEEGVTIHPSDCLKTHKFKIKGLARALLDTKIYYVLFVESESLLALRKKYGLPETLTFKGYALNFHITIGKKILKK